MNRQRLVILIILVTTLVLAGSWRIYQDVDISRTHFMTGKPPKDIMTSFLPKETDPSQVRAPAVLPDDETRFGGATSVLSVIQFGDYQCEPCREFSKTAKEVVARYGGQVRYVWKDMPLEELHDRAVDAAVFARCAGAQDKFWEVHDMLVMSGSMDEGDWTNMARGAGLDKARLDTCRADPALRNAVLQDVEFAKSEGINAVPFIFVGTKGFVGDITAEELQSKIEEFAAH